MTHEVDSSDSDACRNERSVIISDSDWVCIARCSEFSALNATYTSFLIIAKTQKCLKSCTKFQAKCSVCPLNVVKV